MIRCDGPEWLFDRLDFREIADRLQCAGPAALKNMEPLHVHVPTIFKAFDAMLDGKTRAMSASAYGTSAGHDGDC